MSGSTMKAFRWLALLLILLAGAGIGVGAATKPASPTATLPDGADSTFVASVLAERPGDASQTALVLFSATDATAPLDLAALRPIAQDLGGPLIPNEDRSAALVPITIAQDSLTESSQRVLDMREELRGTVPAGVDSFITGPAAVTADLSAVFSGANFMLLGVTALIVAVLLIVTYRSPVLWLIPLIVIGIADRLAQIAFTWVLDLAGQTWDESVSGILSVLVFGAGTNYALLLISRYRDELHHHDSRFEAMAAWAPTVKTIAMSALTVVLGMACLMLSAVPTTRGLGLGAMVGIAIAFLFGAFVLPGVLLFFGRWIFWPRIPQRGETSDHRLWDRIGEVVRRRPAAIVATSLILLGLASIGAVTSHTGLTQSEQFIDTPESISAADLLAEKFPGQDATPATIVTGDAAALTGYLESQGVLVQPADPAAGFEVITASGPDTAELRSMIATSPTPDAKVGGQDAQLYDQELSAQRDRLIIFPLILALVFAALVVVLRGLVAPAIMVASVLLTNIAALGIGWWISSLLFGFTAFADTTPLFAFVFLVALGIDYSIFLVVRAREEAATLGTREGILRALSVTGGVITSAGILLAAVFAALGVLPLVVLAQIGIVIFIGVLLDTLVVRTLLVPALVQLLGERFWWPGRPVPAQTTDA